MNVLKKSLFTLLILSLAPAGYAGNEPAQMAPGKPATSTQQRVPVMDRPEMAPFKQITMFAMKYRQKLSTMHAILEQAKRTGAISADNYKKLQAELNRLNEVEPSMARGGWNQTDVDAFDKQIANYEAEYAKANKNEKVHFAVPAATTTTVTTTTAKSKEAKGSKDSKDLQVSKYSKQPKASSPAPAKK